MAGAKKLVIGASGFLGSHVTHQLLRRGDDVRVLLRRSSTQAIDDLEVERHYGDVFDDEALRTAMSGVHDVFYCVVDARAGLRDPPPCSAPMSRGCNTFSVPRSHRTCGASCSPAASPPSGSLPKTGPRRSRTDRSGGYIQSRVAAKTLVLQYARERGLPAVALCISNTYGPGDVAPTPHGKQNSVAAAGKLPFYSKGWESEVVGVEDAAAALLLAAEKGTNGQRYIISERVMSACELYETAAGAVGANPPRFGVPLWAMYAFGCASDALGLVRKRDSALTRTSVLDSAG